ncbi:MAG: ATP-binding cassette domain-containing protein [Conexivisphaerales archaeon]
MLELKSFSVSIGERKIVDNADIKVLDREKCLLVGPNGAGKTSLLKAIMGFPGYSSSGRILLNGEDISSIPINERFHKGIFLLFQDTEDIGVRIGRLLNIISLGKEGNIESALNELKINKEFIKREISRSLSGGERKIVEMLQLLVSNPKLALIDEFDAGVDFSLLKNFTDTINSKDFSSIIVTHNYSTINMLKINRIFLLKDRMLKEIDKEELERIAKEGYG